MRRTGLLRGTPAHSLVLDQPESASALRAKAPLRVSFAGGGTDVPPFPQRETGVVLSATIARYAYGALRPRADDTIEIHSADLDLSLAFRGTDSVTLDGELDLIKAAIMHVCGHTKRGFNLFLRSQAPPGSGLGSSSTIVVALIGLLAAHRGISLTEYEVADLAYVVEREFLGIAGGRQDHYAASFGGFNFMEFFEDRVLVNPLRIRPSTLNELEHNLLLCYTGATRASDRIIEDQTRRLEAGRMTTVASLRASKDLAVRMKDALLRGSLRSFGELLGEGWVLKRRLSPRVSTPFIDEAYEEAISRGALGGKVTGAGGGGYMLFYCDFERKHRVAEALTRMGGTVSELAFDPTGLDTWRTSA